MGQSILVMEMWCPWKHPFFGLDVMGESTVGRDWLEGVHSEEVRRWENPLEKDRSYKPHSQKKNQHKTLVIVVFCVVVPSNEYFVLFCL